MKKLLCILLIVIFLSSCSSTYFFSTLNSSNDYVEKVENGDFLLETDSLWIAYCFKGESAPVQITIYNKLDKPLFVDWQRSALIVGNVAYPYTGDKMNINGDTWGVSDNYYSTSYSTGSFSGSVEVPRYTTFIPPKTMISHVPIRLSLNFDNIQKKSYKNSVMANKDNEVVRIKRLDFEEDNTPLKFKSYLTVYAQPDKPMVFEQDFYISNLIKTTGINPKKLPGNIADRGDFFYLEKPADTRFVDILLGVTIVAGAVVVDAVVDSNDRY